MRRCGNEGKRIRRAGMLSAAVWNSNYGGAGLLGPHLGDPVTGLAPFWGSHLILLFTLPVSVGEPRPAMQPRESPSGSHRPHRPAPPPASRRRPSAGNPSRVRVHPLLPAFSFLTPRPLE